MWVKTSLRKSEKLDVFNRKVSFHTFPLTDRIRRFSISIFFANIFARRSKIGTMRNLIN